MRFFLKSIDIWSAIESGFNAPYKPTTKWSNVEKQTRVTNEKAMNALYLAISQTKHSKISNCDSAKDAWEILETTMISLGKKVFDTKIIRKVMRSLLERFRMKVTAIELCIDLETMRIEELVGALQTYEFSLPQPKKDKDLACRTVRKNSDELSDEESPDDEELAFIIEGILRMNIKFPRDLENQKRVLRIEMKETHVVQNVMSVLAIVMCARIVLTS